MRLACIHCFTIDAADAEQGSVILRDLCDRIDAASARLDIGYVSGFISGQPQPDRPPETTTTIERLFG